MSSECGQKQNAEVNNPQDEEKDDEILTPQVLACPAFQQQIRDIVFTLIPEGRVGKSYRFRRTIILMLIASY